MYPEYRQLADAKVFCTPSAEAISVGESKAQVTLQGLLDHTASRILQQQVEVVEHITRGSAHAADSSPSAPGPSPSAPGPSPSAPGPSPLNLSLICKWGMDGSTGHSLFKQKAGFDDDKMLCVTLVPLRLVSEEGHVLWANPTPSSPRFCRPVIVMYAKETRELTASTIAAIEQEILHLRPFQYGHCSVTFHLAMTMVDGKVVNVATSTASSQRCSMCAATPSIMNDLEALRGRAVTNTQFGISPLHAYIRCFEAILHIGYKIDPEFDVSKKSQQGRRLTAEEKERAKKRKIMRIQEVKTALKERLGLRVDEPRAGGSGNSNDGNTARRAFRATEEFAACTGVDKLLIQRIHVMLQAVSSCYPLDTDALHSYGLQTAERYVQLYPQHKMTVTLHKLLCHSAAVSESCMLPIGMLSEEAAEATNKLVC